jgi:MiaB-like tRNA modifying enzyme
MKAHVEAYGCTLNFGESREIEGLLEKRGWELVNNIEGCDLAVLVTCVVVETTERAMMKRIKALSSVPRLIISGCMATTYRRKAESIAPNAVFVAPGDLESISNSIGCAKAPFRAETTARGSYSIVPIATGCVGDCAYCIARIARGELRSRPVSDIVDRVAAEAQGSPREIQLTAQDTAAFGLDCGSNLPLLVREICALPQDFRLRIGMMNPRTALPLKGQIAEMYLQPKVFKFLHLPVQSASDTILGCMARGYTLSDFETIVETVRSHVPLITLSTDLIVGYPGETTDDHLRNLELIQKVSPDIVNVTRFSSRPGTKAAQADKKVVGWMAKDRSREITELRFRVAKERNDEWVGRELMALATERGKGNSTIFRTDEYKQIVVKEQFDLGGYFRVKINDATPTYLIGSVGDRR